MADLCFTREERLLSKEDDLGLTQEERKQTRFDKRAHTLKSVRHTNTHTHG